jgi:hypothetical protein
MSHLSFLGCEPARCGNWAARRLEFKRTVGVPHGVRKRRGLNAIFRPPTGFSRDARVRFRRDAGLSCRWLLARQLKLVVWTAAPARRLRAGRTPQPSVHEGRAGGWVGEAPEGGGGYSDAPVPVQALGPPK